MIPVVFVATRVDGRGVLREVGAIRAEAWEGEPTGVYASRIRMRATDEEAATPGGVWLVDAFDQLRELSRGCVLVALDGAATRKLLEEHVDAWELLPLDLAAETVDLRSLAWPLRLSGETVDSELATVCKALGVAYEPDACALEDVRAVAEVYRRLVRRARESLRLTTFTNDERAIVEEIVERMSAGRTTYGPWKVCDGRNYPREALAEVMDALNYCAAEMVRMAREVRP